MEDDLITTKEVGDYRIKVYYCRDSECPITNWGLFGSFFFEYSDMHRLHDECNWKTFFYDNKHDLRDVIDAIVMKHIEQKDIVKYLKKGEANGISFTYNRGGNVWELKHKTSPYIGQEFFPSDLTDFDCRGELIEDLDDEDLLDIICDWSITADVDWKNKHGKYEDYLGGCCHDEVAKHFPELAKFISLHLCNHYGAPMHPVENGIYHVRRSGMSVAMEYLHISEQECVELYKASEDKMYFKYLLFDLGIVDRWKRESDELLVELEDLCGKKWVNPYTPEKERFTLTLTDEERLFIEERIKAGYYSAENIEKRREEVHKAKMLKKRAEICERYDKKIRQAEAEKKIMLCVFDYGLPINNVIYYPHTNTLSFNWNGYGEKITQEEFDDFVNKVDRSKLPEDIRFELK